MLLNWVWKVLWTYEVNFWSRGWHQSLGYHAIAREGYHVTSHSLNRLHGWIFCTTAKSHKYIYFKKSVLCFNLKSTWSKINRRICWNDDSDLLDDGYGYGTRLNTVGRAEGLSESCDTPTNIDSFDWLLQMMAVPSGFSLSLFPIPWWAF